MKLVNIVIAIIVIMGIITIGSCALTIGVAGCVAKKVHDKGLKNITTEIWEGANTNK